MRTDVYAVEESVEIDERDAPLKVRATQASLREPPASKPLTDEEIREVRRRHLAFKLAGGRDAGLRPAEDLLPLSLYPYVDVDRLRGDYPICVFKDATHGIAPLARVVDRSLDEVALEGDDLERCRRWALQLESRIRRNATEGSGLLKLWNVCSEELSAQYGDDPEKQKKLHHDLAELRKRIPSDAQLVGCDRDTARRLLEGQWRQSRTGKPKVGDEIRQVIRQLNDLLVLEDEESDSGLAPDHLKDSVGEGFQADLDFQALSNLLHDATHAESPAPGRRARIESIVEVLASHLDRLDKQDLTIASLPGSTSLQAYARQMLDDEARASRTWLAARLESTGRFDEERHGALLAEDTATNWGQSPSILTPLPPIHVDLAGTASGSDFDMLEELFDREIPVRLLITVGDCVAGGGDDSEPYLPASLGERLLLAGPLRGFLCQRSLADTEGLLEAMTSFLACDQTAVLIVYDGGSFSDDRLHPYLKSAAGTESRVVPTFVYDAHRGLKWAQRFSLEGNEQTERIWPVTSVEIAGADDSPETQDSPFSAASLMLCDQRFGDHFRLVDRSAWHDRMSPVDEYSGDAEQIPYVAATSPDGIVHRVIFSDYVWKQANRVGERWRSLRELGGIANSFAEKAVSDAAERLQAEHRDRIESLEAEHRSVLEATTGKLAEEIISNIAAGLLDGVASGTAPARSGPAVAAPRPAEKVSPDASEPETPEPEPPAIEEEELEILDEAYIETPRCTTCDECTTINPRLFAYNDNKQAYIADPTAGTYRELVLAAEKCPVRIIHPGKPLNPDEPHLDELMKRAEPFR